MRGFFTAKIQLVGLLVLLSVAPALASEAVALRVGSVVLLSEEFDGFTAAGFASPPGAGQLDSALWRVRGLSDGDGSFGGTHVGGDFGRGSSSGGVSSGGIYAFQAESGNSLLGVQPAGSDFTPGSFDLRLENTTAAPIEALDVGYRIQVFNDQNRANSLNFEWSLDDITYNAVVDLDFVTLEAQDSSPGWLAVDRSTVITGIQVQPGQPIFLRWSSDDVSGGGSRDEFGIDSIRVDVIAPPALFVDLQGPANGLAGEALGYAISLTNPSTSDVLENVVVTDTLPPGLAYSGDTSGVAPVLAGNTVQWDFGTLAAGETIAFDLTVDTDPGIAADDVRTNSVQANATLDGAPVTQSSDFATTFRPLVPIVQIQFVDDPAIDDASLLAGRVVWTEGVVTAAPDEIAGPATLVIGDVGGGPWSGLVVDGDFASSSIGRGDLVRVVGEVGESSGLTRLQAQQLQIRGQAGLPSPEILATSAFPEGDPALAEPWESVLVEFQTVGVTEALDFGEWRFDDGSGIARGDDEGSITLTPAVGDAFDFLRGIGWFSFGDYKLQPRNNGDIGFQPDVFEIFEIQGEGLRSPFAPAGANGPGEVVRTEGNIVTAVGSDGFFIQMPDDRPSGALPLASRGLFVFTATAPAVAVGDRVDVTGAVVEFFDFTQIAQPDAIDVTATAAALPDAIAFDAQTPSPDPQNLSCGQTNFECFEGMRASVGNGFVTAPSQSFGADPVAEAWISTDGRRILRGAGAEFPGIAQCPTCPIWSGAPELLEIDPDRFDLLTGPLAAGTRFSATGVIGFSFGDYGLWPTALDVQSTPELPRPVAPSDPSMLTLASLNALNLFDDALGPARPVEVCSGGREAVDRVVLSASDYDTKLNKLAVYIVQGLGSPDVIAIQEVESAAVLDDLAAEIELIAGIQYSSFLEPANDIGNINNGYLVNPARVAVDSVELLAGDECLALDNSPLHDRPPLLLRATFTGQGANLPFAVFNNHMRSLGGIDTSTRTRLKRQQQAQSIARLVQDLQTAEPELPIMLLGDYNAFQFSDGFVDVIGQLQGTSDAAENLVSLENAATIGFDDSNIPDPVLENALDRLTESERYSFIFQAVSQVLDHALITRAAAPLVAGFGYARANADYWTGFENDVGTVARSSDHDGYVLVLDGNRIFADGFE